MKEAFTDYDPREWRQAPSGLLHIIRSTPIDARPFSATNIMLMEGKAPTYCGRDATDWPIGNADAPNMGPCERCNIGYYADEDAE